MSSGIRLDVKERTVESRAGSIRTAPASDFTGVKVFSATVMAARDRLGDEVTSWIAQHPELALTEIVVTQSSDSRFHCFTITVFYVQRDVATGSKAGSRRGAVAQKL